MLRMIFSVLVPWTVLDHALCPCLPCSRYSSGYGQGHGSSYANAEPNCEPNNLQSRISKLTTDTCAHLTYQFEHSFSFVIHIHSVLTSINPNLLDLSSIFGVLVFFFLTPNSLASLADRPRQDFTFPKAPPSLIERMERGATDTLKWSGPVIRPLAKLFLLSTFLDDAYRMVTQWDTQVYHINTEWKSEPWVGNSFVVFNLVAQVRPTTPFFS